MKYIFLFSLLIMAWSIPVYSHPLDLGYLEIDVDKDSGLILTIFDFNPVAFGNPSQAFHKTLGKNFWKAGNYKCQWGNVKTQLISSERIKVSAESFCPEIKSDISLSLNFLIQAAATYKIIGRISYNGVESTFLADKFHHEVLVSKNIEKSFGSFVYMGTEHIGVTTSQWTGDHGLKLPAGIDHILFIIALIFTAGSFLQTVKIISGFTIGHTVSLILATTGLVSIPASIIEPAIALSIVYVATEAFLLRKGHNRILISFFFGLVHGFGFASALLGLRLSVGKLAQALVGFNLGVELGQIIIILLIIPFIYLIKNYSNHHIQFTRFATFSVMIVGSYWFVERTFFKSLTIF
ncbi:MAG: HupE/UreJ family protein [Bacteriovorax sp.]|nr:HupE/UreJ family protein [Bacteriovorax sp.]